MAESLDHPSRYDHTSETLLGALAMAGHDSEAWSTFLARYQPLIQRWCVAWGLQSSDRDDVVQEVLLRLARVMQTFRYDPSKSFRAWLKTVSYRIFLDWSEQSRKPGQGQADSAVHRLLNSVEARDDFANRLESEYHLELLELVLLRVQMRVQPRTWEAFRLTAIDGVPATEVAERLETRIAHVYVARSDVKRLLIEEAAQLEPEFDD